VKCLLVLSEIDEKIGMCGQILLELFSIKSNEHPLLAVADKLNVD
jgi:hypothetical protein